MDERTALERFIRDNPDLERLETIVSDFNPFVSMGWTRQELRHSSFLRWLLDPNESHGLGPYPLRQFLKALASASTDGGDAPSLFDIDSWDLINTTAVAEWESVDVFLQNDDDGFVVVIENKVGTTEHGEQLQRYRERVEARFPGHKKLFVYLTPAGDQPSDDRYGVLSYGDIVELVALVIERRGAQMNSDVARFLEHYVEMVRRHIVEDSEVQELCRRLYANHRQALDLIFEHRPDRQQEITHMLEDLVVGKGGVLDQCSKAFVRFATPTLDRFPHAGSGWTKTGRMILFEAEHYPKQLVLKLILGPGPTELREQVHHEVQRHEVFNRKHYKFFPKWWTFHGMKLLRPKEYGALDLAEIEGHLRERVDVLFDQQLPEMESAIAPLIDRLEA